MELARLGASFGLSRTKADAVSKANEDRLAKRLGEMQDALKRLQALPAPGQMAKQDSMNKIAFLKKRLEALKAMLLHASPEQAGALARELKDIAKELSAVAKSLGGSPQGVTAVQVGSGQAGNSTEAAGNQTDDTRFMAEAPPSDSASTSGEDIAVAQGSDGSASAGTTSPSSCAAGLLAEGGQAPVQDGGDGGLCASLQEAKKLLKESIAMLKAKLTLAASEAKSTKEEKQAKHDVGSAEKSVAELEQATSAGGGGFYSALGALSAAGVLDGPAASFVASGLNVNVSA